MSWLRSARRIPIALVPLVAGGALPEAAAQGSQKWVCDAKLIASYDYKGGDRATIRLSPYPQGGSYAVKKNDAGNLATGQTADGTTFTCTLK